ncbi:MAG: DUF2341 domain-containing protein [Candidatus Komeilibacteria bacterium]
MHKILRKIKEIQWYYPVSVLTIALIIVIGIVYLINKPQTAEATWWNDTWSYRQSITVTNGSGGELTDFQVEILQNVDLSSLSPSKLQANLADLRFTDINHRVLPYWIEDSTISSVNAWIKIPSIPTTGTTIYMYYGNASASDEQSGDNTFEFFDDFDSFDAGKWNVVVNTTGAYTMTTYDGESVVKFTNNNLSFVTNRTFNLPNLKIVHRAYKVGSASDIDDFVGFQSTASTNQFFDSNVDHAWVHHSGDNESGQNNRVYEYDLGNPVSTPTVNGTTYLSGTWTVITSKFFSATGTGNLNGDTYNRTWTEAISGDLYAFLHGDSDSATTYPVTDWYFVAKTAATEPVAAAPTTEENTPGPVGYWNFNEGFGTTAYDSTGYSNNGTVSGAVWSQNGVSSRALDFNGTTDYVAINNGQALNITGDMTVSAWAYFDVYNDKSTIVSKWGDGGVTNFSWLLFANWWATGRIDFLVSGNGSSYSTVSSADGAATAGTWHHIVGVYDAGSFIKLYIDGVLANTNSTSIPSSLHISTMPVGIGIDYDNGSSETPFRHFDGRIDEVMIYDRALSKDEVLQLYNTNAASFSMGVETSYTGSVNGGDGSDGALTVTSANTVVNTYSQLAANEAAGQTVITVGSSAGFVAGDEVMIWQTQDSANGLSGQYEFAKISSVSSNDITLNKAITNSYYSGTFNNTAAESAQMIRIPQYTSVSVESGGSITATTWDGYKGGIVIFRSTGEVEIKSGGSIDVEGDGYRGGRNNGTDGYSDPSCDGECGEGYTGRGVQGFYSGAVPVTKDGGGTTYVNGSGGSYRTSGQAAQVYDASKPSLPGELYGDNPINKIYPGSGGGGGHCNGGKPHGGSGGGMVYIEADSIKIDGAINADGQDAFFYANDDGLWGAGGGSGGAILLRASLLDVESNSLSVAGGASADGSNHYGGDGGEGRIRLDAHRLKGSVDVNAYKGDPVLDLDFDNVSGTTTYDRSGNEYNATVTGATSKPAVNCKVGKCYSFDGGDYMILGDYDLVSDRGTWMGWIYMNDLDTNAMITKWNNSGTMEWWFGQYTGDSDEIHLAFNEGFSGYRAYYSSGAGLQAGQWYHLAATYDGDLIKFYVNGKYQSTTDAYNGIVTNGSTNVMIGGQNNGPTATINGYLDEIKVYNRVLSDREIAMETGGGKQYPILSLSLDGAAGSIAYDDSFLSNNGTIIAASWMPSEHCISGSCLDFNNDDTIIISEASSGNDLDFGSGSLTISAWASIDVGTTARGTVVDKSNDVTIGDTVGYWLTASYSGYSSSFGFFVNDGAGSPFKVYDGDESLIDGKWHHVAVILDRDTGIMTLYEDMVAVDTEDITNLGSISNGYNFGVGGYQGGAGNTFNGKIDEVKMFNYALTYDDLMEEYTKSSGQFGTTNSVGDKTTPGASCADILSKNPKAGDGYYYIDPTGGSLSDSFKVFCDMTTNGGGWTLIESFSLANKASFISYQSDVPINSDDPTQIDNYRLSKSRMDNLNSVSTQWRSTCEMNQDPTTDYAISNKSDTDIMAFTTTNSCRVMVDVNVRGYSCQNCQAKWWGYPSGSVHTHLDSSVNNLACGAGSLDSDAGSVSSEDNWGYYGYTNPNFECTASSGSTTNWWMGGLGSTISTGPILDMDFDKFVGGSYLDRSGNGHNTSSISSDPIWETSVNCKEGRCLNIDTTNDWVIIPANTVFDFAGDYTLEAWIKPNSVSGYRHGIMGKYSDNGWGLNLQENKLNFGSHSCSNFDGTTSLVAGNWYHVVGIYKESADDELYVNGKLDSTSGTNLTDGNCNSDTSDIVIGLYRTDTDYEFDGIIDEVKIYNRALTQAEVSFNYNGGQPVGWWRLGEGADNLCSDGKDACDSSGNSNNGTFSGGPTWVTDTSLCKQGGCLSFDRTDDVVDIGQDSILSLGGNDFTIALWVKPTDPVHNYWQGFVYLGQFGSSNGHLGIQSNTGKLAGGTGDGSTWQTHLTTYDMTTSWQHIIMKRESNRIAFYVNGEFIEDFAHSYTPATLDESAWIGRGSNTANEFYQGLMDDIRIYNYALTDKQVKEVYNQGLIHFK